METALFNTKNKEDLELLISLAKKIGVNVKLLSDEDMLDMGLLEAMNKGETGEYIDSDVFLAELKK